MSNTFGFLFAFMFTFERGTKRAGLLRLCNRVQGRKILIGFVAGIAYARASIPIRRKLLLRRAPKARASSEISLLNWVCASSTLLFSDSTMKSVISRISQNYFLTVNIFSSVCSFRSWQFIWFYEMYLQLQKWKLVVFLVFFQHFSYKSA